jgi:hypothetical protein
MQSLFECKVRYQKIDELSGKEKKVTETYLFDAISFTEAESRIYKEMESMISGEFLVTNIRKANYADIFNFDDGDRWFKCKVSFVSIDEEAGKEKKVSNQIMVFANDVKDAFDKIHQGMGGSVVDFEINSISESPVLDFFPYFKDEETAPEGREVGRRPADVEYSEESFEEPDSDGMDEVADNE